MNLKKLNESIEKLLEIHVYNGSPVDYDKLTYKVIGQGEGHAAHGWGFYFAVNRDVADEYREAGLSEETLSFFGKTYVVNDIRGFNDRYIDHNNEALDIVLKYCLNRLKRNEELNLDELIDKLNSNISYYRNNRDVEQLYRNLEDIKKDIENYKAPSDEDIKEIQDNIQYILDHEDKFNGLSDILIKNLQVELDILNREREDNNSLTILKDNREKLIREIGQILNNDRNHNQVVNDTKEMISFIQKHKNEFKDKVFINSKNQGVVKEFEIPNGPYLEEDKMIKDQSTEIKKALFNLCKQLGIDEDEQNTLFNQVGRELYKDLCSIVREKYGYQYQVSGKGKRADKIVSRLLNKVGIKGIHYFGEEDGECFVVFNSKDIEILN